MNSRLLRYRCAARRTCGGQRLHARVDGVLGDVSHTVQDAQGLLQLQQPEAMRERAQTKGGVTTVL